MLWDFFRPNNNKLYACRYTDDNQWYRAMVYDWDTKAISVLYLDFGNHEMVSYVNLHSLESQFLNPPFQAVCCRLAGVKGTGPNGAWTEQATKVFAARVCNFFCSLSPKKSHRYKVLLRV